MRGGLSKPVFACKDHHIVNFNGVHYTVVRKWGVQSSYTEAEASNAESKWVVASAGVTTQLWVADLQSSVGTRDAGQGLRASYGAYKRIMFSYTVG